MPPEEVARQLVLGGYLQEEPSPVLVADMLDALEAEEGGFEADKLSEEGNPMGPEERHHLYGMLRLRVLWFEEGDAWAEMPIRPLANLEEDSGVYRTGVTSRSARTAAR